jgi:hypothetical protein
MFTEEAPVREAAIPVMKPAAALITAFIDNLEPERLQRLLDLVVGRRLGVMALMPQQGQPPELVFVLVSDSDGHVERLASYEMPNVPTH